MISECWASWWNGWWESRFV